MDRTRKANREVNEATLQHVSKGEALLIAEVIEQKLAELQASVEQMRQTPDGVAQLERRTKAFGECRRDEEETSRQFYDKLRHWLERDVPQTKWPLHPPRQNGGTASTDEG
jgi:vacuolar-type H+-ATPase subunit I/STV1